MLQRDDFKSHQLLRLWQKPCENCFLDPSTKCLVILARVYCRLARFYDAACGSNLSGHIVRSSRIDADQNDHDRRHKRYGHDLEMGDSASTKERGTHLKPPKTTALNRPCICISGHVRRMSGETGAIAAMRVSRG